MARWRPRSRPCSCRLPRGCAQSPPHWCARSPPWAVTFPRSCPKKAWRGLPQSFRARNKFGRSPPMKRLAALVLLSLVAFAPAASAQLFGEQPKSDPQNTLVVETTKGQVVIKLRNDLAPKHAERLKQLTRDGYYNNAPFHRVILGFIAQTGAARAGTAPATPASRVCPPNSRPCRSCAASSAWRGAKAATRRTASSS